MAIKEFDVFVIGTGTAGKTVATTCAEAGMEVAIADNREYGGTCPNRGCDPKKVLVGITEIIQKTVNLKGKGVNDVATIEWAQLQAFKNTFTDPIPAATEKKLKQLGISMYHQSPVFLDEHTLSVEGKTVKAKYIVIASGQKPRELKIKGREYLMTSDDFLNLEEMPKSIVFVGAGYIGMEFAHIAARCGAKVTIVDTGSRPLKPFDKDMVAHLREASESIGIEFIFDAEVTEIEALRKNKRLRFQKNNKAQTIKARAIFNTAGRVPSIEMLDLEKGNVTFERDGISVNQYLQNTSNRNVYACGDVSASGTLPLTPLSSKEAAVVAANILKANSEKLAVAPTPSVVYTSPQLAAIGLTEAEAKKRGLDVTIEYKSVPTWYNAKRLNETTYAYKTIVDIKTDIILGAHLIGAQAGEMINLFALAMAHNITATDFKNSLFTYPSWGNDVRGMV